MQSGITLWCAGSLTLYQHTNGKCPYDFDDRTGEDSGTPSSGTSSSSGSSSSSSSKKKTSSLGDILSFVFLDIPVLLLGVSYFGWVIWVFVKILIIEPASEAKKEKQNARLREEERRAEYQQIYTLCSGKTRTEIAKSFGMPPDFYIDESNLPHSIPTEDSPDRCTVFIASNGAVYHRNPRCCQRFLSPTNIVKVQHLNTCRYCAPERIDLQWYYDYLNAIRLMRKHGIEPIPETPPAQLPPCKTPDVDE